MTKPALTFIDWYANEYDSGAVNADNYRECCHYLQGVTDSVVDTSSERGTIILQRMQRCVDVLRSGANVLECLKRYGIKGPSNECAADH